MPGPFPVGVRLDLVMSASAKPFTDAVYALAFSQDGKWLAVGDLDSSVRVWRAQQAESC